MNVDVSSMPKTDWIKQTGTNEIINFPLKAQIDRIRNNLQILIKSYYTYTSTPNLPDTFENLDIYKINDNELFNSRIRPIWSSICS